MRYAAERNNEGRKNRKHERKGEVENAKRAIYAVAYGIGDVCNESKPSISAELPGTGERFQGILPPLAQSPLFVIRKKAAKVFTLDDLERQGVIPPSGLSILREVVLSRRNIVVVGGTDWQNDPRQRIAASCGRNEGQNHHP